MSGGGRRAEARQGGTGSLTVVGTGIQPGLQTTAEARRWIEAAERVFYLVNSEVAARWIRRRNPAAEPLAPLYPPGRPRGASYRSIVDHVLAAVRRGEQVCLVFYGHPGIFVWAAHEALRRARREGYPAWLLPGVSAEACLFADLGVDPGETGCQSHEATRFLLYHRRRLDPASALVLWQVGVIGKDALDATGGFDPRGLALLVEALGEHYPGDHEVVIYEAAELPLLPPRIERLALAELAAGKVALGQASTLYVPPLSGSEPDAEMARRLASLRAAP